jgi:hypothetical protein
MGLQHRSHRHHAAAVTLGLIACGVDEDHGGSAVTSRRATGSRNAVKSAGNDRLADTSV